MNRRQLKVHGLYPMVAIACLGVIAGAAPTLAVEDYSQWANESEITLNTSATGANVAAAQAGFPVLIRLTSANTAFSFAGAMSHGEDIRFEKSGIHLPYQIERWDQAGQVAEIWVKVDVNGNDATQKITMYWGKPGSTDSSNAAAVFATANGFSAVYHLNEVGNTDANGYHDATANGYNGTGVGMAPANSVGSAIGVGQAFDGVTNLRIGNINPAAINPTTGTISCWVQTPATLTGGDNPRRAFASGNQNGWRYFLGMGNATPFALSYRLGNMAAEATGSQNLNTPLTYYLLTTSWTGGNCNVFVNGVSAGTQTGVTFGAPTYLSIGMYWDGGATNNRWNGQVDEVRVENTGRSADWVKLCYESQKPTASWLTYASVTKTQPSITTDPSNTTVNAGLTATFTVVATGGGLSYQWDRSPDGTSWSNAPGASTAAQYSFTAAYPGDNGAKFRCRVSNTLGYDTSTTATLTVTCNPPTISQHPTSLSVAAGDLATFNVTATGGTFTYQWQRSNNGGGSWDDITSATSTTYSFTAISGDNGAQFRCRVNNGACGNNTNSNAATLTVAACPPPTITTEPGPATQIITAGGTVTYSLVASGTPPLSYEWQQTTNGGASWDNLVSGASFTSSPLTVNTQYRCVVSNYCGYDTSQVVSVTVCTPPDFLQQPSPWAGISGATASFSVQLVAGVDNPHYQWQRNDIAGTWGNVAAGNGSGTTASYTFTAATADDGKQFRCVVTGDCGVDTSNVVAVSVCSPPTLTNPANQNVTDGALATFTVTPGAVGTYSFQWYFSIDGGTGWSAVTTGGTSATYSFTANTTQNGYQYRCQATNGCGTTPAVSGAATLTVCAPARLFAQPGNDSVNVGDTATFAATATGTAPTYQWQRSVDGVTWNNITSATSPTYKFVPVAADNGAKFRIKVANTCGSDSSPTVTLFVCTPPVVNRSPASLEVTAGSSASFSLNVTGTNLTYQWQRSDNGLVWNDIANATDTIYTITTAAGDNGAQFHCNITSKCGGLPTAAATLTVCVPVKVTQQNIGRDSVLVGQRVRFKMTAEGTALAFQWQKSSDGTTFADIPGSTADSLAFAATRADSGITFRCIVSGRCGPTVQGNTGLVLVYTPVHAAFSLTPAAGLVPLSVAFADSSTGSFTTRTWDFNDGTVDANFSSNKNLSHSFTAARSYTVKLRVSGPGGADSLTKQVYAYNLGADPIQMAGAYVSPQKVSVTFANFDNIQTPSQVTVDSVGVWYRAGSLPQTAAQSTYLKSYSVATLQSRGTSTYTDTLTVPVLGAPDSMYGFMNGIFWSDGKLSTFDTGNGTLVLMKDTFPVYNNLQIAGRYAPDDTALVFLDFVNQIDTMRVDSVLVWYSLTGDTTPNFTDKNFTMHMGARTVARAGENDTIPIVNKLFDNVEDTVTAAVVLIGHNGRISDVKKTSFVVGKKRPANTITLHARALDSRTIRLTWNNVAGTGVEHVVIWYRTGSSVPLQYDFTSLMLDSLVPSSVADTVLISSSFTPNTRYYFGAQVYKDRLWSYVTANSSASDSTPSPNASLTHNTSTITSLTFTDSNEIQVCWQADSLVLTEGDSMPQLGIVYSADSMPLSPGANPQVVNIRSFGDCAYLKLHEDLIFNHTYYVSLWLRAGNSAWTAPQRTRGKDSILVPMYKWQNVLLFSKDYDTVYAFNGQLRFTNNPGDPSHVSNKVLVDSIASYGFTALSLAFEFQKKDAGVPFNVGIKLSPLPTGYSAKDVRIFRYDSTSGMWLVDTVAVHVDTVAGYAYESTNQLVFPFVAGIDTRKPSIEMITNLTDSVPGGVEIKDTFLLSDNIANLRWRFMSAKGGEGYTSGDMSQTGVLSDTSQRISVVIPGRLVSQDNGVRGLLIVTDGTYADTVDVSRRVVRDSSDLIWAEDASWAPMSTKVELDSSSATTVLAPLSATPWKYDNTQFRVFRWNATQTSGAGKDKWVEYADSLAPAFSFTRGNLIWVKSKEKTPVRLGRGVTPSLSKAFFVTLPSRQWVDVSLPFNFGITVADIMGATRDSVRSGGGDTLSVDSIQIADWTKGTTGKYTSGLIYDNSIVNVNLNNAAQPLSSTTQAGYTFFNQGGGTMRLVIPPIPQVLSTHLAKKSSLKRSQGWSVKISSTLADGSALSPVYCGYSRISSQAPTYYPAGPMFGDISVRVFERESKRLYGHAMQHAMPEGGCAYLLAYGNDGGEQVRVTSRLDNVANLPKGMQAALYNDATGSFENLSGGTAGVTVEGGSKSFRWLLVGSKEYLAKAALIARPAVLKLFGTYPNPFRSTVRIHYSLPYDGIEKVTFGIYDMRGRTVWRTEVLAGTRFGESDLVWNGRSADGRKVASGIYILRMTAFGTNHHQAGLFDRKMTFIP
jgi:PKD repeat protein